jgi:23S rRNA (cytidine1920-2'-O)/16S rRNA (cytidine1409-2'-O)-methyltransferase
MSRKRLDKLLVEKGYFDNSDIAKRHILAGEVYIDGKLADKPGTQVTDDAKIHIKSPSKYVSRGAEKLLGFLKDHPLDIKGKVCLDVGVSTGGFTQVLLERGAKLVYSVDVGKGVLDLKLRNDHRVILMEETNARYLEPSQFEQKPELATIDVSFISLKIILPPIKSILDINGEILSLIKPQFEAKPEHLRKGILTDEKVQREILDDIKDFAVSIGLKPLVLTPSKIKGAKGNQEFFLLLKKQSSVDDRD